MPHYMSGSIDLMNCLFTSDSSPLHEPALDTLKLSDSEKAKGR